MSAHLIFDQISEKGGYISKSSIPRTVKTALVEYLRDEIIHGDLVPGQHIRLDETAVRFDVSTMPVREALRDLEAEGLVSIFPHRGAVVTQLSADDLQDIYQIRGTLEQLGTHLSVPHMTGATHAEMTSLIEEMDSHLDEVVTLVRLNHRFHTVLYSPSGRRHLCDLIVKLRYRTQHYLRAYIAQLGRMPQAQVQHRAILEACKSGDAELAGSLMYDHVVDVGSAIAEHVGQLERTEETAYQGASEA